MYTCTCICRRGREGKRREGRGKRREGRGESVMVEGVGRRDTCTRDDGGDKTRRRKRGR